MIDTGQIAIDRANARIAAEEEAAEKWRAEHTCGECEWCEDRGHEANGHCKLLDVDLTPSMMADTIAEAGCFEWVIA